TARGPAGNLSSGSSVTATPMPRSWSVSGPTGAATDVDQPRVRTVSSARTSTVSAPDHRPVWETASRRFTGPPSHWFARCARSRESVEQLIDRLPEAVAKALAAEALGVVADRGGVVGRGVERPQGPGEGLDGIA